MIRSLISYIVITVALLSISSVSYASLYTAKITIKVEDEEGKPVEGAKVGIGFEDNSARREISVNGVTKLDGRFSASENCNGYIGYNVKKLGYYMSIGNYVFDVEKQKMFRFEPWNPEITIVLRKIENPVPMYARDTKQSPVEIPVSGQNVGFDLILFDWLAPYGRGQVADFFCNLVVRESKGNLDFGYNLNITFPREFDGIQSVDEDLMNGSEFKLPRFAPEKGYNKKVNVFVDSKSVGVSAWSSKKNRSYIFRVRSEVEDGKFKRALYGKIIGDIDFGKKKQNTAFLNFKYYLNPDYTRNLEYDPEENLFLNLPDYEQVRIK